MVSQLATAGTVMREKQLAGGAECVIDNNRTVYDTISHGPHGECN